MRNSILIVDDDAAVRDSLSLLLRAERFPTQTFDGGAQCLAEADWQTAGCVITDIRMADIDGLQLLAEMKSRGIAVPVIVMTGHGEVKLAVQAMKAGAVDFLEKPFDQKTLIEIVTCALVMTARTRTAAQDSAAATELLATLTPRERDVFNQLVNGHSNKIVAYHLGISPRTVEVHRANLMGKMQVRGLAELVRISYASDPTRQS